MEASASFVANCAGATTDKNGDSLGLLALLNQNNSVILSSEAHFFDKSSMAELIGGDFFETGHDAGTSCNGK